MLAGSAAGTNSGFEALIMPARSQLRRRCSPLARAWDLHIPAICDRRKLNFVPGGRRDEASVGTNALDLALRLSAGLCRPDHAATVLSAEKCFPAPNPRRSPYSAA